MNGLLKKSAVFGLILALLIYPPGPGVYEALAGQIKGGAGKPFGLGPIRALSFKIQDVFGRRTANLNVNVDVKGTGDSPLFLEKRLGAAPNSVAGQYEKSGDETNPLEPQAPVQRAPVKFLDRAAKIVSAVNSKFSGFGSARMSPAAANKEYDGEGLKNGAPSDDPVPAGPFYFSRRFGLKAVHAKILAAAAAAFSAVPVYAHIASQSPVEHLGLGSVIIYGAYYSSMALGFIMGIPELRGMLEKKTFTKRVYGLIAAALASGFISAPAQQDADRYLWGAENISLALILATGVAAAKFFPKRESDAPEPKPSKTGFNLKPWLPSLGLSASLIASGFGIYFGIAAHVPSWLSTWSPISMTALSALAQAFIQTFFIGLFVPDLKAIKKGLRPNGFSTGLVLVLCALDACFVVWSLGRAWENPLGHIDLVLLGISNAVQFIMALIVYRALRRPEAAKDKSDGDVRLAWAGLGRRRVYA